VSVWAAILAGGSGTRFWPLSTPERPKQLLPLAGDRPLLVQAVERLSGLVPPERVLILTGPFLVDQIAATVPQVPRANIFAEPRAASTAPALVWAAQRVVQQDPEAELLSLHADWAVACGGVYGVSVHTTTCEAMSAAASWIGSAKVVPTQRCEQERLGHRKTCVDILYSCTAIQILVAL